MSMAGLKVEYEYSAPAENETFHNFYHCWLAEQNLYLHALISASNNYDHDKEKREEKTLHLQPLIIRIMDHYRHYYETKSRWAKQDVLAMLSPSWTSSLEDAFLWIGGWRPSMAFQLLHSKSGLQLEAQLYGLARGLGNGDLGDLSHSQMRRVDEYQRCVIREEKDLTEKLAKCQETLADESMVELSQLVGESMRGGDGMDGEKRVPWTLASKEEKLVLILEKADHLRLKTLNDVVEILTPIQAIHLLIAAAELHLRVHEWGMKRDDRKRD